MPHRPKPWRPRWVRMKIADPGPDLAAAWYLPILIDGVEVFAAYVEREEGQASWRASLGNAAGARTDGGRAGLLSLKVAKRAALGLAMEALWAARTALVWMDDTP